MARCSGYLKLASMVDEEPDVEGVMDLQLLHSLAPLRRLRLLVFGGMGDSGFDIKYCVDEVFQEFVSQRARELLGEDCNLSKAPESLVQACYVEHYLQKPVDYSAVLRTEEPEDSSGNKADDSELALVSSPGFKQVVKKKRIQKQTNQASSVATRRVRDLPRLAPVATVKSLFSKGPVKSRFDLNTCSDSEFADLATRRGEELLGKKFSKSAVPAYFIQACYVEHFLGREVEYVGIIQSVESEYRRIKIMKERTKSKQQEQQQSDKEDDEQLDKEDAEQLWRPSRQDLSCAAPLSNLIPLFPGGSTARGKTYVFDVEYCSDRGFARLVESTARKYVPECELGELPAYLVQTCYLEHFGGRKVDHSATIHNARCKRRSWHR